MKSIEILFLILNTKFSKEEIQAILESLDLVEWQDFLEACSTHGVKPLVYSNISTILNKDVIPDVVQQDLCKAFLRSAHTNTLNLHHGAILLNAIRAEGIPVIGLKGIYLVENIYPNIAARPFGDIDLLVRKGDIPQVIKILEDLGYYMQTYFSLDDANQDIKHVPPMSNRDSVPVEIHWSILEEDQPFSIDLTGLWARALPVKIAGVDTLALSPEDLLLHLCLHLAYQHHLSIGLRGLADIVQVLNVMHGGVDWQQLKNTVREWGAEKPTWVAMTLAAELLNAAVPIEVLSDLAPEPLEPWILPQARKALLAGRGTGLLMTPDLAVLAAKKGFVDRLRVMLSRVFLPRRIMARIYGVPPGSPRIIGFYFKRMAHLSRWYGPSVRRIFRKEESLLTGAEEQRAVDRLRAWMGKGQERE